MSSISIDKNISNAFAVIYATYENVLKLISCLQNLAMEKSDYVLCTDKFLRWNSEGKNIYSWAYHTFTLVFQREDDAELDSGWRDGPLYVFDINLYDYDEATVQIARFDYNDANAFPSVFSTSDHWKFDNVINHYDDDFISYKQEDTRYEGIVKDVMKADKKYWGVRRVVGFFIPLTEITFENVFEKVFDGFDKLIEQ